MDTGLTAALLYKQQPPAVGQDRQLGAKHASATSARTHVPEPRFYLDCKWDVVHYSEAKETFYFTLLFSRGKNNTVTEFLYKNPTKHQSFNPNTSDWWTVQSVDFLQHKKSLLALNFLNALLMAHLVS